MSLVEIIEIDENDKQLISCALEGLPPLEWWLCCHTTDQKRHWSDTKEIFYSIFIELQNHFSGKKPVPKKEPEDKVYELAANRYIDLYRLIYSAWADIEKESSLINFSPESPGRLLVYCIELECKSIFWQCQSFTEVNPRELYKLYLDNPKIDKIQAREESEITEKDRKRVKKHQSKINRLNKDFGQFYDCLSFIIAVAKKSKNKRIRRSLEFYLDTCDELDKFINVKFNRYQTKHQWHKGKVLNFS